MCYLNVIGFIILFPMDILVFMVYNGCFIILYSYYVYFIIYIIVNNKFVVPCCTMNVLIPVF